MPVDAAPAQVIGQPRRPGAPDQRLQALEMLAIQGLGGAEIHRNAMLHEPVAFENLFERCERAAFIRHVMLGDDFEPVDHRLVLEDVLDVWIA
jgi:hypothetical protein